MTYLDLILKTVGATYGPKGRTVMLDRSSGLISTKDGQTVFWELWPTDREEKLFITLIQEAVSRINREVGDGTTTAALFCALLTKELLKRKAAGANIQEMAQDLKVFSKNIEKTLFPLKKEIESEKDLREFAFSVSNRDKEIADSVSSSLIRSGEKGLVSVEEGKSRKIETFLRRGYRIEKGYESSDLGERIFEECLVACIDSPLENASQVIPILEEVSQFPYPLLILSKGIYGEALNTLCLNDRKLEKPDGSKLEVCAARVPGREDQMKSHLEDLAALSGSTLWVPGLIPFESYMFGSFEKAVIQKDKSTFYSYEDKEELILKRISQLETLSLSSTHDQDQVNRRIAMLSDGFVVLEIGGATQTEIRERKARVEDVLAISSSILDGGIVPGGAMSFLWLWEQLRTSEKPALRSFAEACRKLWKFLLKEQYVIQDKLDLENPWTGFDLIQNSIRDFQESPLLADSFIGLKGIIEVSCSVASEILLVDRVILKSRKGKL